MSVQVVVDSERESWLPGTEFAVRLSDRVQRCFEVIFTEVLGDGWSPFPLDMVDISGHSVFGCRARHAASHNPLSSGPS